MKECVTHHHACDCREDIFKKIEEENVGLKELIEECHVTISHASIFIRTRERMHKDGISLYDELLEKLKGE